MSEDETRAGYDRARERTIRRDMGDAAAEFVRLGQRVSDGLEEAGFRRDVLEGTGEVLYDVVLQQLQVTNRLLQSSFRMADALVRRGQRREEDAPQFVEHGECAIWTAKIRNNRSEPGDVSVRVSVTLNGEPVEYSSTAYRALIARRRLEPGQTTHVRLELGTSCLTKDAHVFTITVALTHERGRNHERDCNHERGRKQERREELEVFVIQGRPSPCGAE